MGVVRYSELVAKIKIVKFFPGMFVSDLRKFMLTKISCYTVVVKYSQVWSVLHSFLLCSYVGTLNVILFCMPECSATQLKAFF